MSQAKHPMCCCSLTCHASAQMARNMGDLLLLDSVLRDSNSSTRGNGALPAPGVSCAAPVDEELELAGLTFGMPMSWWPQLDSLVRSLLCPVSAQTLFDDWCGASTLMLRPDCC